MLEDIHDRGQSHPIINSREACYKIRDCIKRGKSNGKESYYQHKTWAKVHTNVLSLLLTNFCNCYQSWENQAQKFLKSLQNLGILQK